MTIVALVLLLVQNAPAPAGEQPAAPARRGGRISGTVVSAATGQPIEGVHVTVYPEGRPRQTEATGTDALGHFEIAGLAAGRYLIDARHDRFVSMFFGQRDPMDTPRPVDLRQDEEFRHADFALPRTRAIEGRVVDEFGDPAPDILVQAFRREFAAGRYRLVPMGRAAERPTDDRGHYRISGVPPGDYYVAALSGAFAGPNESGGFAPTYYTSTTDPASATVVRVRATQDAAAIHIQLAPAQTARVAGTLLDRTGRSIAGGTIFLAPRDRGDVVNGTIAMASTTASGAFAFRNVPVGSYVVQGIHTAGEPSLRASFGSLPLTLSGEDVSGLTIVAVPGASARGKIVLDSRDGALPHPQQVHITARPVEFESGPIGATGPSTGSITTDATQWTFRTTNHFGRRVVRADVDAPGWALKRILLDGLDVTDEAIDFRKGDVEGIEITLTNRTAAVTGTVRNEDGTEAADYAVVLFSPERERWRWPSRFVALGRPNQDGSFAIRGVLPDDYLVAAVRGVPGATWQDPEVLETLRPIAQLVTLIEGTSKEVTLKLRR